MKKRRKARKMRKTGAGIFLLLALGALFTSFNLGNEYLRAGEFDTVRAEASENARSIAARYATKAEDAKKLTEAIIEVNGLSADGAIRKGQSLKIPLRKESGSM